MNQVINKMQKSAVIAVGKLFHHKIFNPSKFRSRVKTNQCNIGDRVSHPRPFFQGSMCPKHYFLSTASSQNASEDESEHNETIAVTFVLKDGEEKLVNVPVGMSMLEAAHANNIEIEGACAGSLVCGTCFVIVMDTEFNEKLEEPCSDEKDMIDHVFFMSESPRLGCQVIAKRELDGIRLALPMINRHFTLRGSGKYEDDNYRAW